MRRKAKQVRISANFNDELREIARMRVANGLARPRPTEISPAEMTELITRTNSWNFVKDELRLRRKKNGK